MMIVLKFDDSWPAAGFPNLGMKLSVLTSLPWRVVVRIGLYVEHVLVMLSPLVWTQGGCGCLGSVRIHTSRHDIPYAFRSLSYRFSSPGFELHFAKNSHVTTRHV